MVVFALVDVTSAAWRVVMSRVGVLRPDRHARGGWPWARWWRVDGHSRSCPRCRYLGGGARRIQIVRLAEFRDQHIVQRKRPVEALARQLAVSARRFFAMAHEHDRLFGARISGHDENEKADNPEKPVTHQIKPRKSKQAANSALRTICKKGCASVPGKLNTFKHDRQARPSGTSLGGGDRRPCVERPRMSVVLSCGDREHHRLNASTTE